MARDRIIAGGLTWTLLLGALCFAAAPPPAPPVANPATIPSTPSVSPPTAPASRPAGEAIPKDVLQQMYARELGDKYNPAHAERLHHVHQLLERYFEASQSRERKAIVSQIEAAGLDPNVVGRLTRLRMYWPALEAGVYYVNERIGPHAVRYFFGVPRGYDRTRPWPLVIKLPTPGAFLTAPPPNGDRVAEIYHGWINDELARHPDAVVLMPLLDLGELYGPSYAGMNVVVQPMHHVAGRVNVDPARVYLSGHSMAAHAVWNLGLHFPTYFAAINPMAGGARAGWQRLRVINLRNVLPVVWHDADDDVIKVASSRDIVRILRTQKVDVDYEETKGIGHAPDARTVERLYAKTRARTRDLYPAEVSIQSNRPDTMFNRVDWVQIWQPLEPGKERKVLLRRGSGSLSFFDNTYRIQATRKGNRIDVATQNVDSFRLYLNDQMVDFSRAVTVVVNGRGKFEEVMRPGVEDMLKDQLFLGRGWRYYTAGIDVNVVPHPPIPPATRPATRPSTGPAPRPTGRIIVGPSRD